MSDGSNINTGIYQIRNLINNDCYIGSSAYAFNKRWNTHRHQLKNNKHHSIILQRAWDKYGSNNFIFEIVENCIPVDCIKKEQFYIDKIKPKYNINKIAESPLGRKFNKEHCKKISDRTLGEKNPFFGKHHTEETRKLISSKLKGKNKGKYIGEKNPMYNNTHSDENKKVMSDASNKFWNSARGIELKRYKSIQKTGHPNKFVKKGHNHPKFIPTIYTFIHICSGDKFIGTIFDFRKKYTLCGDVYYLLDGKKKHYKQYKGWIINYEK